MSTKNTSTTKPSQGVPPCTPEAHQRTGVRRTGVRIRAEDWQAGFQAGGAGMPANPVPAGIDGLAWISGWIEGAAKRRAAG
jgi:hypothetical protein